MLSTAWFFLPLRPTLGSAVLIGITCICTPRRTDLNYATQKIHATLMTISQPRYAAEIPHTRVIHTNPDNPKPLAPANGAPADATKDPLLRDKVHGQEILEVRKALAFAGFTHKSPRVISYVRADKAFEPEPNTYGHEDRGRSTLRGAREVGKGRAISM